jgi:hypothetical protein
MSVRQDYDFMGVLRLVGFSIEGSDLWLIETSL